MRINVDPGYLHMRPDPVAHRTFNRLPLPLGCFAAWFGLLMVCAQEPESTLYFWDLQVRPAQASVLVTAETVALPRPTEWSVEQPAETDRSLDRPIRALIRVLDEMDRLRTLADRKQELADAWAAYNYQALNRRRFYIASLTFECTLRAVDGQLIDTGRHMVSLGLAKRAGYLMVRSGYKKRWRVPFSDLREESGYRSFLDSLWARHGSVSLKRPKPESYLVDLYYQSGLVRPELLENYGLQNVAEDYAVLRHFFRYRCREQLGTTLVYHEQGKRLECRNGHLKYLAELDCLLNRALAAKAQGLPHLHQLELLAERAPADTRILAHLVSSYLAEQRTGEALALLDRRREMIEHNTSLSTTYRELLAARERYEQELLANKETFPPDQAATVKLLAPSPLDFVGGPTDIFFQIDDPGGPFLQAVLSANGVPLASIDGPPYHFRIDFGGMKRETQLRIKAYFETGTSAEAVLPVRVIDLNSEECIQLISLRTVVTKGRHKFLVNLERDDFKLHENGQERPIAGFEKDRAPLRIALLLDTSSSMTGDKLYQAQYAVNRFLGCLSPQDRAFVYTFDARVLRLPEPFSGFDPLNPMLYTLRPQYSTALNDALAVARADLEQEQGRRVIIVVSDGSDSSSSVRAESLLPNLEQSGIPVYAIILGDGQGLDRQGARFLERVAGATGSITTLVEDVSHLNEAFAHIHDELKSFYFLAFYSQQKAFDLSRVQMDVRGFRTRARYYQHLTAAQLQVDPSFADSYFVPTIVETVDQ